MNALRASWQLISPSIVQCPPPGQQCVTSATLLGGVLSSVWGSPLPRFHNSMVSSTVFTFLTGVMFSLPAPVIGFWFQPLAGPAGRGCGGTCGWSGSNPGVWDLEPGHLNVTLPYLTSMYMYSYS